MSRPVFRWMSPFGAARHALRLTTRTTPSTHHGDELTLRDGLKLWIDSRGSVAVLGTCRRRRGRKALATKARLRRGWRLLGIAWCGICLRRRWLAVARCGLVPVAVGSWFGSLDLAARHRWCPLPRRSITDLASTLSGSRCRRRSGAVAPTRRLTARPAGRQCHIPARRRDRRFSRAARSPPLLRRPAVARLARLPRDFRYTAVLPKSLTQSGTTRRLVPARRIRWASGPQEVTCPSRLPHHAGGNDQSPGSLKSTSPPGNTAPLKLTAPPENRLRACERNGRRSSPESEGSVVLVGKSWQTR
jgi:hypothetical protein